MQSSHILLVEEKKERSLPLSLILESNGFKVKVVESAKAAIKELNTKGVKYRILISDIVLKDMSLMELLRKLKKKHIKLPFIVISGYKNVEVINALKQEGPYAYLIKPIDPEELTNCVSRIIEGKKSLCRCDSLNDTVLEDPGI